jgi:hypothetical protein
MLVSEDRHDIFSIENIGLTDSLMSKCLQTPVSRNFVTCLVVTELHSSGSLVTVIFRVTEDAYALAREGSSILNQ